MSPHFDDAVLSAFSLLQRVPLVKVLSVFTAAPLDVSTDWDRGRGFASAIDHMSARIVEEDVVMRHLGVAHHELGFVPVEYLKTPRTANDNQQLVATCLGALPSGDAVALPVGAGGAFSLSQKVLHRLAPRRRPGGTMPHPDHLAITDLLFEPLLQSGREVWLYEDLPYLWAKAGDDRATALSSQHGRRACTVVLPVDRQAKAEAINLYTSQASAVVLRPPDQVASVLPTSERFWRFSPTQD